jgi:diguanylate cyclase (GGDEF)-like protein
MDQHDSGARSGSRTGTPDDSEGLFDWNLRSDRIHFSPRWLALIGCDADDVGSQPEGWFGRVHPDDNTELSGAIDGARAGASSGFTCRYRLRHNDGTYRWMACRGMVVRDGDGHPIRLTGSQTDVTVEMVTDRVTGLPNRLLLLDRMTRSLEHARRHHSFHFAVLVIDLGRPGGPGRPAEEAASDPLLTAVARRLESCLRNPGLMPSLDHNDLVARIEGDYFAIVLNGLKAIGHAKVAAERILREILNPIPLGGREVRLSASIGVAVSATGYTTADQMVHDAQAAQHRARMLGGSHCEIFDTDILKAEQAELQLEGDFAAALQRREFVLLFQPIVSLDSYQVVGFEALVRWQHPMLGMIPPLDFIPLAEKTGFIVPLGNWILREACRRLREWDADMSESRDVSISVNISSVQTDDPSLVDQIAEALRESGLEPRRLVLELTEGIAMANPPAITTLLMRLRAIGVRISVDDFGTGYSSLAYLRQFPIDTLKIDRSFVRGMVTNRDAAEIIAGVMNLAKQLGLHVVAEGIEHEEQCGRLRALKCDAGQGTLFGSPLDVETAAALLKRGLTLPLDSGAAGPSAGKVARVSQWLVSARVIVASHRAPFAAAALMLLVSVGFAIIAGKVPAARGSSPRALTDNDQQTSVTTSAAVSPTTPALDTPSRPAPPNAVSLNVVHLHRLGSCRGRLDVTRTGVAFVSETDGKDEAFTLKYTEFLNALSDDTLILRSATRTYRFQGVASGSRNKLQLRNLADRIARFRG